MTNPFRVFLTTMRYSELKIETQRQAPARARTEGESILRRAGYIDRDGEPTPLGRRSYARLEELFRTQAAAESFALLDLPALQAEGGAFFFPTSTGRLDVLQCPSCGYTSLQETARFRKTAVQGEVPAPVEKVLTPECSTIEALAGFLGVRKTQTAKALMYTQDTDGKFVFVVIRGDMQLSDAKLRQHVGEVRIATPQEIVAAGAAPGYASPIGLQDALIVVDDLVPASPNLVAGANEPGYHLKNTNYGRDYSAQVIADLALAEPDSPCPSCGSTLSLVHAELLADDNGFCLNNILEAVAETHHDEKGLMLPLPAAPFAVYLLHLSGKQLDTRGQAVQLHDDWERAGLSVLLDDRDERAGVKFADADLIGCPVRVTVGERGMKDGMVELKARTHGETMLVPFAEALPTIRSLTKTAS